MRILYISPYAPARDGIGDYTAAFVLELRALGHEVGVVSASSREGAPAEVIAALPPSAARTNEVRDTLAAWRPDVVHVQFAVAAFGTKLRALLGLLTAMRPLGVRIVVTLHEVTRDTASLRALGDAIYRRVAKLADVVVVHTDVAREVFVGRLGAEPPAVVIPHPRRELPQASTTPAELRERHDLGDAPVVLSFGFIHVDKGLDDLVGAFHLWRASGSVHAQRARLVVAGAVRPRRTLFKPFELRDRLHLIRVHRLIRRSNLTDSVVFTGYVPAGEIAGWFDAADVTVLPYRRIEESGVAHLAATAGALMIVSDVGELSQASPDWTFPARDVQRLAEMLQRVSELDAAHQRREASGTPSAPDLLEAVARTAALYAADRTAKSDACLA